LSCQASERAEIATIEGHDDCIYAVAISPDGKRIATSSYDKLIKIWDAATGREIRTLKDHIDAVYALAFTPDGTRLVSGAADRTVKIWNAETGERLYTFSEPLDGINTIALDPLGKRVAAAGLDKTIRIWSLGEKNGKLLNSQIAHEDAVLKLAWSPDGKTLISSSADRTIKIFNADDLSEIRALPKQSDWIYGLDFAPGGQSFAAGRQDGSLEIYQVGRASGSPVAGVPARPEVSR
jgi:WD40 repeat protein